MAKKKYEKMSPKERMLLAAKQSRPREPMPRPVVYEDRTKFNRNREKAAMRRNKT